MTTTFITGANKGLGHETARRLSELGHTVVLGARDIERGQAAADALGVRFVPIDVADDASAANAAEDVSSHEGHLDVLINNAGTNESGRPTDEIDGPEAIHVLNTNVAGIVRVTHAFLPLLRRARHPTVINVSSGMGSVTLTHDPDRVESHPITPLYAASKAAVTMLTTQYARGLPELRVNAVDPGYTATDLNAHSGHQSVTEGTDAIVTLATESHEAGTGRFIDRFGPVRW